MSAHGLPSWEVFGAALLCLMLAGCPGKTGTPTSQKQLLQCTKTGERCKLKHGPLGVCMPLIDAPKTYECVPQH